MSDRIYLHPKHGLNPTLELCFVCGKEKGTIALLGRAYNGEAPRHMVINVEPCDPCREKYLKKGVMLVEAERSFSASNKEQFKPTGTFTVLKDSAFKRIFNQPIPPRKIVYVEIGLLAKLQNPAKE